MPIYELKCPKCNHQFTGLVMANTKEPKEWVCSQCGSHETNLIHIYENIHPLENEHAVGCPCCGGTSRNNF
ncbi:FmdB family zinc ribbon protein [Methyloglobulus sp.]|uniref:FmdB family zinc ribbon protein n=1 Tax=Methyloglobulus sp. TaxID=2518622 RepID=UPI003988CA3A